MPLRVAVAWADQEPMGHDQLQEVEFHETMPHPITKWTWMAKTTAGIPETLRRGFKFASTPPCGPVFLALPNNTLREEAKAAIWDQAKFDVPMRIRPDKDDVEKAARLLIEAKNPLMSVGDEITWCHGEKEAVELPNCSACRSPPKGAHPRSASGRSRSRPGIRCTSEGSCARCASPA